MKLIKLQDKFILISDEKVKEGDIGYISFEGGSIKTIGKHFADDWMKVISENPDFSLLSDEDCIEIGWVDVEKLWLHFNKNHNNDTAMGKSQFLRAYEYITAQSLNDKIFGLKDMRNAFLKGQESTSDSNIPLDVNNFIQSLQQTSWDVEVEMEEKDIPEDNELKIASDGGYYSKPTSYVRITRPKITNNSIKVLRVL